MRNLQGNHFKKNLYPHVDIFTRISSVKTNGASFSVGSVLSVVR